MQRLLETSDATTSGADGVAQTPHECLLLPTFHRALDVERSATHLVVARLHRQRDAIDEALSQIGMQATR